MTSRQRPARADDALIEGAMRSLDCVKAGDMIDGAIELARRARDGAQGKVRP